MSNSKLSSPWEAIVERDRQADGRFFYAVQSTGVYCRPSCASRLPLQKNVSFHATRLDAEAAGFRACKRCRPERLDTKIRFAIGESSWAPILVARSESGVCAILPGADRQASIGDLRERFPGTHLIEDRELCEPLVMRVIDSIADPRRPLDFPLDLHGTDFQRRVWEALQEIPPGQTRTYAQIAQRIGAPRAVRAVARACGANPLAVLIPCHRVLRADGALSGYRWGVERKRELLQREALVCAKS